MSEIPVKAELGTGVPSPKPEPTPLERLSPQLQIFAHEYVTGERTGKRFNGFQAAKAAGYGSPEAYQYELKRRPEVKAAIDWLLNEVSPSNTEIEGRLIEVALSAAIGELLQVSEHGTPSIDFTKIDKYRHLIKSFKIDTNGNPVVEFHDPMAAMRDILKVRGMTKEGLEVSGPGGGAVPVQLNVNFVAPNREPDVGRLGSGDQE